MGQRLHCLQRGDHPHPKAQETGRPAQSTQEPSAGEARAVPQPRTRVALSTREPAVGRRSPRGLRTECEVEREMSVARGRWRHRNKDAGRGGRGVRAHGIVLSEEVPGTSQGRQRRERAFCGIPLIASSRTGNTELRGQKPGGELGVFHSLTRAAVTRADTSANVRQAAHLSCVGFAVRGLHLPACPPRLGLTDSFLAHLPRPPVCESGEKATLRAPTVRPPHHTAQPEQRGRPRSRRV